jgi:hypothetical protein
MRFFSGLADMHRTRSPEPQRKLRTASRLELHVTHTCNLACESCSHYSNHGHSGNLDLDRADHWMAMWSKRIDVEEIRLLGGEPTVHPDFPEFIPLARRHWPLARIRIVTNGFFLRRHPDLPLKMADAGNADLALSIHHDSPAYLARLRPITDLLAKWQHDHGTIFHTWSSYQGWTKRYLGNGDDMQPFEDGRPRQSWEICPAKPCKQLHEGKLWKCAPVAYLGLQKQRYNLSEKWDPYLQYQPLEPTCSDEELDAFLALEDEPVCAMCSAKHRHLQLPDPMRSSPQSPEIAQLEADELEGGT